MFSAFLENLPTNLNTSLSLQLCVGSGDALGGMECGKSLMTMVMA